jgi:hypothetical protein
MWLRLTLPSTGCTSFTAFGDPPLQTRARILPYDALLPSNLNLIDLEAATARLRERYSSSKASPRAASRRRTPFRTE